MKEHFERKIEIELSQIANCNDMTSFQQRIPQSQKQTISQEKITIITYHGERDDDDDRKNDGKVER